MRNRRIRCLPHALHICITNFSRPLQRGAVQTSLCRGTVCSLPGRSWCYQRLFSSIHVWRSFVTSVHVDCFQRCSIDVVVEIMSIGVVDISCYICLCNVVTVEIFIALTHGRQPPSPCFIHHQGSHVIGRRCQRKQHAIGDAPLTHAKLQRVEAYSPRRLIRSTDLIIITTLKIRINLKQRGVEAYVESLRGRIFQRSVGG